MKYAFIDYENLNSLNQLPLQDFDKIFLFIGKNQKLIELADKFEQSLNITLITVKLVSKNNLDFHLVYYLGKQDEVAEPNVEFYIFSNDKGYEGICQFIQNQRNKRCCKLISMVNVPSEFELLCKKASHYLLAKSEKRRPAKIISLRNDLISHFALKGEQNKADKIIHYLLQNNHLKIEQKKIIYLKK